MVRVAGEDKAEAFVDRILNQIKELANDLNKNSAAFKEMYKSSMDVVKEERQSINFRKEQWTISKAMQSLEKKKNEYLEKQNKQTAELISLRRREKMEIEQEHGRQVRRNIELRAAMENVTGSLSLFNQMLGGIGFRQAGLRGVGGVTKFFGAAHKRTGVQAGISANQLLLDLNRPLGNILDENKGSYDLTKKAVESNPQLTDKERRRSLERLSMMKKAQKEIDSDSAKLREGSLFGALNKHPLLTKIAQSRFFEKIAKWADENKGGIAISLVSMGLFIGLLKKMFDASPVLTKMFEMFKLMFDLVLRPFGDMIGFFLLPILRVVMATVIPLFSRLYPKLTQFGLQLGNILTNNGTGFSWTGLLEALGFVAGKIDIWDVLAFLIGGDHDNASGEAQSYGLGFAALGAGLSIPLGIAGKNTLGWTDRRLGGHGTKGWNAFKGKVGNAWTRNFGLGDTSSGGFVEKNPSRLQNALNKLKGLRGLDPMSLGAIGGALEELILGNLDPEKFNEMITERSEDPFNQLLYNPESLFPNVGQAEAASEDITINVNNYGIDEVVATHISEETANTTIKELKRLREHRYS